MSHKVRTYIILATLAFICKIAEAQQKIEGIVNQYTKVSNINATERIIEVDNMSFKSNDTVLLIQMNGVTFSVGNYELNNTGNYEFHIVDKVEGNRVFTKAAIGRSYSPTTQAVQLIRVPYYRSAQVDGVLTCKDWDQQTGGVLAISVGETLTLNADIDVTGKGFHGGGINNIVVECSTSSEENDNNSGYKGEGVYNPVSLRGRGTSYNGGGGGNGKFSGGGGGANAEAGGSGGKQACDKLFDNAGGLGGEAIKYNETWKQRAFMGGGGGSGTGNGTKGGNGGGIVIIIAGDIRFNGDASVKAIGGSVSGSPTEGGAGGGGGGGSILLSITHYTNFKAEIWGGIGGNVNNSNNGCSSGNGNIGAGAGGGGGLVYVSANGPEFDTQFGSDIRKTYDSEAGNSGDIENTGCAGNENWAFPGGSGSVYGDLQIPLYGFLFNFITNNDATVCPGEQHTLNASQPQGGNGTYQYEWQQLNGDNWVAIPGSNVQNYTTPVLDNTSLNELVISFRRVVTSRDNANKEVKDFSLPIHFTVKPKITNNLQITETTVCGNTTLNIKGTPVTGGNGIYTYQWEQNNNGTWQEIGGATQESYRANLQPGEQNYRRKVTSDGCTNISQPAKIHVLSAVLGNIIVSDQQLCETETPEKLTSQPISGGSGDPYTYNWQENKNNNWVDLGVATLEYQPPGYMKISDLHYRRIVTSGSCKDTSNSVLVHFDELISPAVINSTDQELHFQFETILHANPISSGQGQWSVVSGTMNFSEPTQPTTTVNGLEFGNHVAQWKVSNGQCPSDSAQIAIQVFDVTIPSGFSPNNDRINDCYRIIGAENAASSELVIFNRANVIVYQSSSFKGSSTDCSSGWWDGRSSSGNDLPSGTYFYQLTLNGNKVYKGYVVLKK